jgi:hypothetical protein
MKHYAKVIAMFGINGVATIIALAVMLGLFIGLYIGVQYLCALAGAEVSLETVGIALLTGIVAFNKIGKDDK